MRGIQGIAAPKFDSPLRGIDLRNDELSQLYHVASMVGEACLLP